MSMTAFAVAALLQAAAMQPAASSSPPPVPTLHGGHLTMTCPIGGERFEALQTSHYSTFGVRPDFRPYSYWVQPLPIPECPSNGLLLFRDFTPEQLTKLALLITSREFAALRRDDVPYYRAQWLATRIGLDETTAIDLLMAAIWQAKPASGPGGGEGSPAKVAAYQDELVRRIAALPTDWTTLRTANLTIAAANAERERGRFSAALRWLDRFDTGNPRDHDIREFAAKLRRVIARKDTSSEPLDMVPVIEAARRCVEPGPATKFERGFCAHPNMRSTIERIRAARAASRRPG